MYTRVWNLSDGITLGDGYLLGQLISIGTNTIMIPYDAFVRMTTASLRRPTFSVISERFGDITEYVKNYNITRNIEDSLHEPNHARGWVVLYDEYGDFIENGQCVFRKRDQIKIYAGFQGTRLPRLTGVITETKVDTGKHEINLSIGDYGYIMKKAQTSGDYADYNTPKLLVNKLLNNLSLPDAEWQNEAGMPTTHEFSMTDLSRRTYWAITHGATMSIFYVFYFDYDGIMRCKRRDYQYFVEDYIFTDDFIMELSYDRDSELINKKQIDHSNTATWNGFLLSDNVRWSETALNCYDYSSQAKYGDFTDSERDELIDTFGEALLVGPQTRNYYAEPGQVYSLRIPAYPMLELMDSIFINSVSRNIKGWFSIMAINETHIPGNWWQELSIMSQRQHYE